MNKEYTIPAKPTKYKGRLYRSRLEARVASYFDLNNFTYEYEPIDLGNWSPDFLLTSVSGKNDALVEVKPSYDMFDIRKFIHVDFNHFNVWLLSPGKIIILSRNEISDIDISKESNWIKAANSVMFLDPESNG